ncbi:MAG: thymidylate synthase [Bacillota bacterium]
MKTYNSNQDLFKNTCLNLLENPEYKCSPRGMYIHENIGFSKRISDPRNRIINNTLRKWDIHYALGEFLWYLYHGSSLKEIEYYAPSYKRFSDDGIFLYGAYGSRLFDNCVLSNDSHEYHESNMYKTAIETLKKDPDSRQSIMLIWRQKDAHVVKTKDLPCTVYLQFFIRNNKLNMITNMRSNDIWLGTPNDIFCFTLLQEVVANDLSIDIGFYQHNAGSIHIYENSIEKIKSSNTSRSFKASSMGRFNNSDLDTLKQYEYLIKTTKETPEPLKFINNNISSCMLDMMWILYEKKIYKTSNDLERCEKIIDNIKNQDIAINILIKRGLK